MKLYPIERLGLVLFILSILVVAHDCVTHPEEYRITIEKCSASKFQLVCVP